MTRARILADYVSSGVTAAEFDQLDTTSGTPGSGNFLRGDKTWQTAGSTSASDLTSGVLSNDLHPDGVCVNMQEFQSRETNALTTSYVNYYEIEYTTKTANPTIAGEFFFNYLFWGSAPATFGLQIYRNSSATVTTSHTSVYDKYWIADSLEKYRVKDHSTNTFDHGIVIFNDDLDGFAADASVFYAILLKKGALAGGIEIPVDGTSTSDGTFTFRLQEHVS